MAPLFWLQSMKTFPGRAAFAIWLERSLELLDSRPDLGLVGSGILDIEEDGEPLPGCQLTGRMLLGDGIRPSHQEGAAAAVFGATLATTVGSTVFERVRGFAFETICVLIRVRDFFRCD